MESELEFVKNRIAEILSEIQGYENEIYDLTEELEELEERKQTLLDDEE